MAEFNRDWVMKVLEQNSSKNFVQRILRPGDYPTLPLPDGSYATHLMEWAEADGKYYVYPRVMYDGKKLHDYGSKAFEIAMQSGNAIEFDSPDEAEFFSQQYKQAWEAPK
ncbi:MAG: hypothetical protein VKI63_02620 [Cyanobium sp.]|nr:hypothetical protein [Cyanobium sp.]